MKIFRGIAVPAFCLAVFAGAQFAYSADLPQPPNDESLKKRCEGGDAKSCDILGYRLKYAHHNATEAKKYYRMACDKSYQDACNSLADIYRKEGDWKNCLAIHETACKNNTSKGGMDPCENLYQSARIMKKTEDAVKKLTVFCGASNSSSCATLGHVFYFNELGGDKEKNRKEGIRLIQKSCAINKDAGCELLKYVKALEEEGSRR